MTTPTNNAELFANTAIATLLRFKPSMKVDDNLMASIVEDLQAVIPVSTNEVKLTTVTRAMLPALKGGAMIDSLSDDIVIHVPAFSKATKKEQTDIKVDEHSVTFALSSYDVESVRYFSLALAGLVSKQQDYDTKWNDNCKLTALVDFVIPSLQGGLVTTLTKSVTPVKLELKDLIFSELHAILLNNGVELENLDFEYSLTRDECAHFTLAGMNNDILCLFNKDGKSLVLSSNYELKEYKKVGRFATLKLSVKLSKPVLDVNFSL